MDTQKLKEELKSFLISMISFLTMDGIFNSGLFIGDFSDEALKAFGFAVLRAIVKAMITLSLPQTNASLNVSSDVDISATPDKIENNIN